MKKAAYKTTTFETGNENFMIDIVEHEESFISLVSNDYREFIRDIWLYRKNIGIKQYVIGELKRYWQGKTTEQRKSTKWK